LKTLTDLEICKKIAEIEGLEVVALDVFKNGTQFLRKALFFEDFEEYNPITDKALLWDLMVKYRVMIDWYNMELYILNIDGDLISNFIQFADESELPRAVLLAIIEAHGNG